MAGCKYLLILMVFFFPLSAVQESISQHYERGLSAYRNSQYELAIQEYESILSNNWDSPELYYNLGNAFYRSGQTAGAVWAFENCLKLSPDHSHARHNLNLANLKVKDRVDFPEPPLYLNWYLGLKERFTPTNWIHISLSILLLISILTTLNKMTSYSLFLQFRGVILSLFFISLFITLHSIWSDNAVNEGIIFDRKVEVRSEPNSFSTRLFEVHAGLKVKVNENSEDWVEIELLDGKTGWIENKQIRLIQ